MKKSFFVIIVFALAMFGCNPAVLDKFEYGNKLSEESKSQPVSVKEIIKKLSRVLLIIF